MGSLIIKPRSRIFHGHDWIMRHEIARVTGDPAPGEVVTLKDPRQRPLGSALYNPQSNIVARRFCRRRQDMDRDFLQRRIEQAAQHRRNLGWEEKGACRLVWSESDGLPGLIVDRFLDCLVVQTLTLGMDLRLPLIQEVLETLFQPRAIVERNDAPARQLEGLDSRCGVLRGELPDRLETSIGGVTFEVDLLQGQKTGLYLDQADNYAMAAGLAEGHRVLDCFCNEGGFALACAAAGARTVTAVESSEHHAERARQNARRLGLHVEVQTANAFDYLKQAARAGESYDLIILDPPSFTKTRRHLQEALRGYKEIHLRAASLLEAGGRLLTFCCSHHVGWSDFEGVVGDALVDARRSARLIRRLPQGSDHPILVNLPESEYLKGLDLEMIAAR